MFERFSDESRRVVVIAQEVARELRHPVIDDVHLLLALSRSHHPPVVNAIAAGDVDLDALSAAVASAHTPRRKPPSGHVPFTPAAKRTLETSLRLSVARHAGSITPVHLMLAVLQERGPSEAIAAAGGDIETIASTLEDLEEESTTPAPHCGTCRANLATMAEIHTISVRRKSGDVQHVEVLVCSACNTTIGTLGSATSPPAASSGTG